MFTKNFEKVQDTHLSGVEYEVLPDETALAYKIFSGVEWPDILIQYVNLSDYLRGKTDFGGIVVSLYRCGDHVLNPSLSPKKFYRCKRGTRFVTSDSEQAIHLMDDFGTF